MTHGSPVLVATLALALAACNVTASDSLDDAETGASPDAAASDTQPNRDEPPTLPGPIEHASVIDANGPTIVLEARAEDIWATGSPEVATDTNGLVVRRPVDPAAAPAERMAWVGRTVRVFHDARAVCTARIGTPSVAAMFTILGQTALADDPSDDPLALPTHVLAARAWDESRDQGAQMLVAPLVALDGDCSTGLWAASTENAVHALSAAVDADDALRERVRSVLRASDEYREAERDYESQHPDARAARWDEDPSVQLSVRRLTRNDGATFVWAWMAGGEGCGGWEAAISRVWRLERDVLAPVSDGENVPTEAPAGVIDARGDGSYEWIRAFDNALLNGNDEIAPLPAPVGGEGCGC